LLQTLKLERNQIASFGKIALIIQDSLLELNALPQVLVQVLPNLNSETKMMTLKLKLLSQLAFPMDQTSQDALLESH
jgi:hypothetical protein